MELTNTIVNYIKKDKKLKEEYEHFYFKTKKGEVAPTFDEVLLKVIDAGFTGFEYKMLVDNREMYWQDELLESYGLIFNISNIKRYFNDYLDNNKFASRYYPRWVDRNLDMHKNCFISEDTWDIAKAQIEKWHPGVKIVKESPAKIIETKAGYIIAVPGGKDYDEQE